MTSIPPYFDFRLEEPISDRSTMAVRAGCRRTLCCINAIESALSYPEETAGRLMGRAEEVSRLSRSLVVDIGETRSRLGWAPSHSVDEGLGRTVAAFRSRVR